LRAAGRPDLRPNAQALLFGAGLPIAFAPFISLTGDYYDMGSILVSRVASWLDAGLVLTRWRSDDLFKLAGQLFGTDGTGTALDALGLALSFLVGAALALGTYALGVAFSQMLPISRRPPTARFTATGTSA
jgi:hypothetical protein